MTKRVALYARVSSMQQNFESQLCDLRELANQRGFVVVHEYSDKMSGAKSKRPGLDEMMSDAARGKFDVVMVWAFDRLARSVKHFLSTLDELNHLNVEFLSYRENVDTSSPLGRAMICICGTISELEKNLIAERVRSGMRRARLEGRQIGRAPLQVNRVGLLLDRQKGMTLNQLAKAHRISKASVCRVLREAKTTVSEGLAPETCTNAQNERLRTSVFAG
jgi:DNA invertase Pin-like site-specific DNA recombinase